MLNIKLCFFLHLKLVNIQRATINHISPVIVIEGIPCNSDWAEVICQGSLKTLHTDMCKCENRLSNNKNMYVCMFICMYLCMYVCMYV